MLLQRILSPFVDVRKEEAFTALLMFVYSFLAMTAYNIIQPLTRSKVIQSLGAVNVPWVILGSGLVIGVLMVGYTKLVAGLPRRWALPITQGLMAATMVTFWFLFRTGATWVSVAFYVWGALLGILLISQFWTLANGIYDPRQAKRMFGFVGGGVMLGGMTGSGLTALIIKSVGTNALLLWSSGALILCMGIVSMVLGREQGAASVGAGGEEERGVTMAKAISLLRGSRQIQIIALIISFGSLGAAILDQQVNMAAEVFKGAGQEDSIGGFLAQIRFYTSLAAFVIQVWITPRIHRYLGIGFALLMLPTNLSVTAAVILLNNALWAPALARVTDQSFRYTVDKTTREVLFLPLPSELRQEVKPLVDVTVDRLARALGAIMILILIQPWGFALRWNQLSVVSLTLAAVWFFMAVRAKREYLASFRRSIEQRIVQPEQVRLNAADLSTIETLVQELAQPDAARVVYAIDVLESLDKRNLITPLLLYHESANVRARALRSLAESRSETARRWAPNIRRLLADPDAAVRAGAIAALGAISNEDAASLARPMLADEDPRIRATAAAALSTSSRPGDLDVAEAALAGLIADTSESSRAVRRDVALAIRQTSNPRFRRLLIPLLYDPAPDVADEAMASVRAAGSDDFVFVPTLIALLRHRRLKGHARTVLVGYGEPVVDVLAHFMRDPEEDIWVRRHIPATLAQISGQKTVDVLAAALADRDGFLRYKAVAALERLRRSDTPLTFPRGPVEKLAIDEAREYFNYLSLHHNVFGQNRLPAGSTLALALEQKLARIKDRLYRLLALIYPWRDIAAAQWTIANGDSRSRASASEYLDNILEGEVRKRIMPVLEEMPVEEKVRRGNVFLKTRPRDVEETLLQLINDDDQVVAAAAIDTVRAHKIWALADDIEHVLAHRDVRDWYVFEAASWALAEQRMPAERRRELWHEPLPAAELATRLRELPLFASLSIDELFRIASTARQVRHDPGSVLLEEGEVPETIHFLLDGRIVASSRDGAPRAIVAPAALGFTEALSGMPMPETMRTDGLAVTLVMRRSELRTLLADNVDLVSGLFATLSATPPGVTATDAGTVGAQLEELARSGLSPVEKVLALQRVPLFSRVAADEMRHLADAAQAVDLAQDATLFTESAAPALWLVLSGELALTSGVENAAPRTVRSGEVIGALEVMSGKPLGLAARVLSPGVALRLDREDLFSLLSERPELLRQIFSALFRVDAARMSAF
jgi:ATP/ADP translocase/CRP-like cAMP-binding protein/HEAT repeat protein